MSPNGLYSFSIKQVLTQSEGSLRRDAEVIEQIYSPEISMPFSFINLIELNKIANAVDKKRKIPDFSVETLLSNYNGHTLLSLFQTDNRVLDIVLLKMSDRELDNVEDI